MLFDFKNDNLSNVRDGERSIYYNGQGTVIDYEIYCNNTDIKMIDENAQLLMLIDADGILFRPHIC